jgi:hypothetical protein
MLTRRGRLSSILTWWMAKRLTGYWRTNEPRTTPVRKTTMSDYLLDTQDLIRCLRDFGPTLDLVQGLADRDELGVSVRYRVEVLARMSPRAEAATPQLLSPLANLPVTVQVADLAGNLISGSPAWAWR